MNECRIEVSRRYGMRRDLAEKMIQDMVKLLAWSQGQGYTVHREGMVIVVRQEEPA